MDLPIGQRFGNFLVKSGQLKEERMLVECWWCAGREDRSFSNRFESNGRMQVCLQVDEDEQMSTRRRLEDGD